MQANTGRDGPQRAGNRAAGEAMGHLLLRRMAGEAPEALTALIAPKLSFRPGVE